MIKFNVNADRYAKFIDASMGMNGVDKKKATSPDTMLERVIDFLMLGALHKRLSAEYDNFNKNITKAIEEKTKDPGGYTIPADLTMIHEGHTVTFIPEQHGVNDDPQMIIKIEGAVCEKKISQKHFKNYCTMQLLMKNTSPHELKMSLTEKGILDLSEANLSHCLLPGIDLSNALLSHANFTNADLKGANLQGAFCQNAKFNGANLQGALCQNTDMTGADLRDIEIAESDCILHDLKEKGDKKRTQDISTLCDKIRKSYEKDGNGKVSSNCNGLFRLSPTLSEINRSRQSLDQGTLNVEEIDLKVATSLLKNEFRESAPLDKETFLKIKANPKQALQLYLGKLDEMTPEAGKRCKMILDVIADAYDNAENTTESKFNKSALLTTAADPCLFAKATAFFSMSNLTGLSPEDIKNSTSTKEISTKIIEDYLQLAKANASRHLEENTALVGESRFSSNPIVNDVIASPWPTLAESHKAEEGAEQPAQNANTLSNNGNDILSHLRHVNDGNLAAPTTMSQMTAEVMPIAAETKKAERSEDHPRAMIETHTVKRVKELTAFFEGRV